MTERKAKKEDRGELIKQLKEDFTETEKVILRRRSVRMYKKEQVPEFMVKRILEAGRFAPSGGNCQPWKFIVLRDQKIINEMTDTVIQVCKKGRDFLDYSRPGMEKMESISKFIIRIMKNDLHWVPFGAMSMIADKRLGLWHGAPTVILIFSDQRGVGKPELDCGIAGENMVIAAHSMGLGTCWVGFSKPCFDFPQKWGHYFGISYPFKFASSLAVGWPEGNPDGMVVRQTHAVDWYENGVKKVVY
ncbi:MAG: nitroreductase family protein [Desulfomonilia bacterium]